MTWYSKVTASRYVVKNKIYDFNRNKCSLSPMIMSEGGGMVATPQISFPSGCSASRIDSSLYTSTCIDRLHRQVKITYTTL